MAVTFKVGKSFIDFISINGFEQKQVDSEKHYYVNSKGNQIKIDNEKGIITLLNKYGNVVDFSSTFNNEQIEKFAKED